MRREICVSVAGSTFVGIVLTCLTACGRTNTLEGRFEEYIERLQRVTRLEASEPQPTPLPLYPRHRERQIAWESQRMGLLESFDLAQCNLQQLVNARNSNLGKVMPASQLLLYELEFLQTAATCMRTAQQLDTVFLARLTSIVQVKQSNLSKVFWAATLDADEFEHNLGLSVDPLPTDMESIAGPSQEALDHLVHIAQGLNDLGVETDSERLETKLQALDQLRFGGRLNRSLQVATAYLDVVTSLLKETLEVGRLCPQGIPSRRGKILYNVLRGQYIDGIQPYMTKLDRHGRAWLQSLNKLFALQPAEIPDTMKRYQDAVIDLHNPNGLWRRFRAAQQLHTDAWQAVLESCGIKAGSPAT